MSNFFNQLQIVIQLYDESMEYSVKTQFEETRSSFLNTLDKPTEIINNDELITEALQIEKIESKKEINISKRSLKELFAEFDQDYSRKKELFIYGLNELKEVIEFGLSLDSLYVDKSSLSKIPIEPDQISEVKIIDFNNDKLINYLSTMDGIIGVIKETDKEAFDAFKNK